MQEDTPSSRIVAAAQVAGECIDSRGRIIKYRRLNAIDRARLLKAIGPEQAANMPYLGMAMLVASATEIDGMPVVFPRRDKDIEALLIRFDDDGMNAIGEALSAEMEAEKEKADNVRRGDAATEE